MGFFAHPALSAAPEGPLANYAFLDQLAALRWGQKNIDAFGGDPARVTIVGESAGGISVVHLLTWPAARGLFRAAAVLSGGGRTWVVPNRKLKEAVGPLPSAEDSGVAFAESVGVADKSDAGLAELRALPAERVNGEMSMAVLAALPPTYAGGPVTDGDVVAGTPQQSILAGRLAAVPLLVGTTGEDLGSDFPPDRARPLDWFGADAERARPLYDPDGSLPPERVAAAIAADRTMQEPARFLADRMTAAGAPAWIYRFDYVAESLQPKPAHAGHSSELPYLFDRLAAFYGASVSDRDRAAAKTFHAYFVNFVKGGDPSGPGLPAWARFEPAKYDLMLFGSDGAAAAREDPWRERLGLVARRAQVAP